ncbi:MAG: histidinol-phosphate transaminase [Myxococcota bacterium]|nr:histidinol-phosphate transaminase [Myxococcota bacterium]
MASLVGDHIENLVPYAPGKPIEEVERELGIEGCVKLASNENPLGPSPRAMEAVRDAVGDLHYYPDGGAFYLKQALSDRLGVGIDELVIGNGSNELLEFVARTFLQPGENAVTSAATFIVYKLATLACGQEIREAPLGPGQGYDLDAMAELVDERTKVIFLANPNNPTGTCFGADALASFLERVDARFPADERPIVVLDEAYREYVDLEDYPDAIALWRKRPRTIVMRTFSKAYGLAALRCGYAVATADLVSYMNRVRAPFNGNSLALIGAEAALGDQEFIARSVAMNQEGKELLTEGLSAMGLGVVPSYTNFVLVDYKRDCREIFEQMMRLGVIVRPMAPYGLTTSLRVTIGTPEQNARLLAATASVLEGT